jgi:hypothetical protein
MFLAKVICRVLLITRAVAIRQRDPPQVAKKDALDNLKTNPFFNDAKKNFNPTDCKGLPIIGQQLKSTILDTICSVLDGGRMNFLVFGTGYDSPFWIASNPGGHTVFLENHKEWAERQPAFVRERTSIVNYTSFLDEALQRIEDTAMLREFYEKQVPSTVKHETHWDIILVDSPIGNHVGRKQPGRGQSIYAASLLSNENTTVFVDDCERAVEAAYSQRWLVQNGRKFEKTSNGHGGTTCRISPALA